MALCSTRMPILAAKSSFCRFCGTSTSTRDCLTFWPLQMQCKKLKGRSMLHSLRILKTRTKSTWMTAWRNLSRVKSLTRTTSGIATVAKIMCRPKNRSKFTKFHALWSLVWSGSKLRRQGMEWGGQAQKWIPRSNSRCKASTWASLCSRGNKRSQQIWYMTVLRCQITSEMSALATTRRMQRIRRPKSGMILTTPTAKKLTQIVLWLLPRTIFSLGDVTIWRVLKI